MTVLNILRSTLRNTDDVVGFELEGALADAERMADQYAEVRPQSYVVPIEKFFGLSFMDSEPKQKALFG